MIRRIALLTTVASLAIWLAVAAFSKPAFVAEQQAEDESMAAEADPAAEQAQQLMRSTLRDAESQNADDLARLGRQLADPAFLSQLDDDDAYAGPYHKLRLARVMQTLSHNEHPAARAVLLELVEDRGFVRGGARQELLIKALVPIRPAPEAALGYWRLHTTPQAVFRHIAVDALAANGSEPALQLLETLILDPAHSDEEKVAWMRDAILTHRNDQPMLEMCERLLRGRLASDQKVELVRALFDYRPNDWYLDCEPPLPPDRGLLAEPARERLRSIGRVALTSLDLDDATRERVEREID